MIALLAAVLALAGAPADTPTTCHAQTLTQFGSTRVFWGYAWWTTLPRIDLYGPVGCTAALYLNANPSERAQLAQLNPAVNWPWLVGEGLLLDLHEAEHVALNSGDECLVEKTALQKLPQLLAGFGSGFAADAMKGAQSWDAAQPTEYHGC